MKRVLFLLILVSLFIARTKSQVLYIEKGYSISDIEYYHKDANCPYFAGNLYDIQETNLVQLKKYQIEECPYCYQGKEFKKSQKLYIPRYATNFVERSLVSESSDSLVTNQIVSQKQVLGGKLLVTVSHENVNSSKMKRIVEAHQEENMAKIATIANSISTGVSILNGHNINAYISSLRTQNCAASVQMSKEFSRTAESLEIFVIIENKSDHEIALCDEKEGRTFHILPNNYILFFSYDLFDGVIRVEDEFAPSKEISYLSFNTKNYLIKVRPYQIDKEYYYINCPDVSTFLGHYIMADEIKKDLVSYKVNRKDFIYLNTNE